MPKVPPIKMPKQQTLISIAVRTRPTFQPNFWQIPTIKPSRGPAPNLQER